MDSNHDIVPTLRMMGGVMVELAADEIDRLRSQVARLGRMADTAMIPGSEPTHRCKVCGAYWRKWNVDGEASWNLNSHGCGECCDNAPMGDQIEALSSPARVGGDEREAFRDALTAYALACYANTSAHEMNVARDRVRAIYDRAALSADGGEESPSLTNPLTPYGMLVRALRITTATTLMDMARYRNVPPSLLSGMEFGRKPVTIDDAIAASEFFSEHGVAGTLGALTVALQAAIAANQAKGDA